MDRRKVTRILQRSLNRMRTAYRTTRITRTPDLITIAHLDLLVRYRRLWRISFFKRACIDHRLERGTRLPHDLRYMVETVPLFLRIRTPHHRKDLSRLRIKADKARLNTRRLALHTIDKLRILAKRCSNTLFFAIIFRRLILVV